MGFGLGATTPPSPPPPPPQQKMKITQNKLKPQKPQSQEGSGFRVHLDTLLPPPLLALDEVPVAVALSRGAAMDPGYLLLG